MADIITLQSRAKTAVDHLKAANVLAGNAHVQSIAGAPPRNVIEAIGKAMAELTQAHVMLVQEARRRDRTAKLRAGHKVCSPCEGTGMNIHDSGSIDCPVCHGSGLA